MYRPETPHSSESPHKQIDLSEFDDGMVRAALAYQAALEKIQKKNEVTPSIGDTLNDLYRRGDKEALDALIDELADDAMEQHPQYDVLINNIKQARARGQDYSHFANEITQLKEHFKEIVVSMAGLPDETRFTEIEQSRNHIAQLLNRRVPEQDRHNIDALYKALNILVLDEKTGKYTYRFPEELMPESVNKKWGTYLASVYRHLRAIEQHNNLDERDLVQQSDSIRKNDHDSLTADFAAVLNLPHETWNFTTARALLATIRDRAYPTLGSLHEDLAEREDAKKYYEENLDGVLVGELLMAHSQ